LTTGLSSTRVSNLSNLSRLKIDARIDQGIDEVGQQIDG
jgi:hypothetical protein